MTGECGFITSCRTDVNIRRLIRTIHLSQLEDSGTHGILFIDFSNAYNRVNRMLLYSILAKNSVLTMDEKQYLKALHERIILQCGNDTLTTKHGLHQGSPISPLPFDIYLDDMIKLLCTRLDIPGDDIFIYADDLAIKLDINRITGRIMIELRNLASEYNLVINEKKCGILWIPPLSPNRKLQPPHKTQFEGIPVINTYKYLGIQIDGKEISPFTFGQYAGENKLYLFQAPSDSE